MDEVCPADPHLTVHALEKEANGQFHLNTPAWQSYTLGLHAFISVFILNTEINFVKATPCAVHLATYLGAIQPTDGRVLDLCGCHRNCLVLFRHRAPPPLICLLTTFALMTQFPKCCPTLLFTCSFLAGKKNSKKKTKHVLFCFRFFFFCVPPAN